MGKEDAEEQRAYTVFEAPHLGMNCAALRKENQIKEVINLDLNCT